jgi:hypothetical protein
LGLVSGKVGWLIYLVMRFAVLKRGSHPQALRMRG